MAAGFSLVDDLNKGDVVGQALKGSLSGAINTLSANSQALIKTDSGRKALVQAVGIAAIGTWARKALPATKIGGSKFTSKFKHDARTTNTDLHARRQLIDGRNLRRDNRLTRLNAKHHKPRGYD